MTIEQIIEDIVRRVVREEMASAAKQVRWLTVKDFAARHSVHTSTVRQAIREGRLAAERIGRGVRIAEDARFADRVRPETAGERADRVLGLSRRPIR